MDKDNFGALPAEARVMQTVTLGIEGMTCDHCARRVEKALRGLAGVKEVAVERAAARAQVTFDSSKVDVTAMHGALLKSGYKPTATPAA